MNRSGLVDGFKHRLDVLFIINEIDRSIKSTTHKIVFNRIDVISFFSCDL